MIRKRLKIKFIFLNKMHMPTGLKACSLKTSYFVVDKKYES